CGSAVTVTPGHLLVRDQRVGHGLLGGLYHRREERVYLRPGDEPELVVVTPGAGRRVVAAEPARIGGGEGQEQGAGEMRADGAGARDPVDDPPGQRGALAR